MRRKFTLNQWLSIDEGVARLPCVLGLDLDAMAHVILFFLLLLLQEFTTLELAYGQTLCELVHFISRPMPW